MNAYRRQQLAIAAAIDAGDYDRASDLLQQDVRTFAQPPPDQSGTTGHNRTLTPRRKCGIIKAIKRHVSRKIKCRRAKIMTIKINLTQDAYINNGECRLHTDSGKPSAWALRDWYEAAATDSDGNKYRVIWALRDDWDAESGDESDACDWDNPAEIIRLSDGANVTDRAKINW